MPDSFQLFTYLSPQFLFPDTVTILLISFQTLSLYFLFLSRHCHYTSYFFQDTVTILLIYSRHCRYTSYFFPDTVTILLISSQTLSLYFLFDMSYNSSHFRTNFVNFSSLYTKTGSASCKQTLKVYWTRRKTVHIIGIEEI